MLGQQQQSLFGAQPAQAGLFPSPGNLQVAANGGVAGPLNALRTVLNQLQQGGETAQQGAQQHSVAYRRYKFVCHVSVGRSRFREGAGHSRRHVGARLYANVRFRNRPAELRCDRRSGAVAATRMEEGTIGPVDARCEDEADYEQCRVAKREEQARSHFGSRYFEAMNGQPDETAVLAAAEAV